MPAEIVEPMSFADRLVRINPPWLQRRWGAAFMRGLGDTLDVLRDRTAEAVKARFPGLYAEALPYIGRDRKIIRGYAETDEGYAARLRRWLPDHQRRGGPYALLRQRQAFWAATPRRIDLVYASGTRYVLDEDGTITRDTLVTNANVAQWARASLFYYEPTPHTITFDEYQNFMAVPREWNAAHMLPLNVFVLFPGCSIWGYPPNTKWGASPPEPWGCAIRVNDLYPGGVPAANVLTLGGYPVTVGEEQVTI